MHNIIHNYKNDFFIDIFPSKPNFFKIIIYIYVYYV